MLLYLCQARHSDSQHSLGLGLYGFFGGGGGDGGGCKKGIIDNAKWQNWGGGIVLLPILVLFSGKIILSKKISMLWLHTKVIT